MNTELSVLKWSVITTTTITIDSILPSVDPCQCCPPNLLVMICASKWPLQNHLHLLHKETVPQKAVAVHPKWFWYGPALILQPSPRKYVSFSSINNICEQRLLAYPILPLLRAAGYLKTIHTVTFLRRLKVVYGVCGARLKKLQDSIEEEVREFRVTII